MAEGWLSAIPAPGRPVLLPGEVANLGPDDGAEATNDAETPRPTRGCLRRRRKHEVGLAEVQEFLAIYHFADVNALQQPANCLPVQLPKFLQLREKLRPLHWAAKQGNLGLFVLLLKFGADRDQRTSRKRTLLQVVIAAQQVEYTRGRQSIINLLVAPKSLCRQTAKTCGLGET